MYMLPLIIALRFIFSKKKEKILSIISIFSTISIIVSVSSLVISLNIMSGFKKEFYNKILSLIPHGDIKIVNPHFVKWIKYADYIKSIPDVIDVIPYIDLNGFIKNGKNINTLYIRGINLNSNYFKEIKKHYDDKNSFKKFIPYHKQIIIEEKLANILKVKNGDWITIFVFNNSLSCLKCIDLQVSNILHVNSFIDNNFAIIPLLDAQNYINKNGNVDGLAIKINNVFNINKILDKITKIIKSNVIINSWINTHGFLYYEINIINTLIYLSIFFTIIMSYFNVIVIIVLIAKNKKHDINILINMGANNKFIKKIFIYYGLTISFISSIIGIIIGILISINLKFLINIFEQKFNLKFFSKNVYFINFIPTEVNYLNLIFILIIIMSLSILTSYYAYLHVKKLYISIIN